MFGDHKLPPRYDRAQWCGPIDNRTPSGLIDPLMGVVVHTEEGTEVGTDAWFHNDGSQVSAHLGIAKTGTVQQFVDFDDKAWAEVAGNSRWISCEFEGDHDEPFTREQLIAAAELYAWLHVHQSQWFPLHTSDSPTEPGLGYHAMGGAAWGGHYNCPGNHRTAQRTIILAKALMIVHDKPAHTPKPSPHPVTPPYQGLLDLGSDGEPVTQLTAHLHARGWPIRPTSDYSRAVERTVANFQAEKGLKVDGECGPVTWWAVWHLPVT